MSDAMTIEARVRAVLVEILVLDDPHPAPDKRFFADLGGESIEVLELSFQLEKLFGVRIDINKILAGAAIETDARGVVTPASLQKLKSAYPFLPTEKLDPDPTPEALKNLLTVGSITQMVRWAQGQSFAAAPANASPVAPIGGLPAPHPESR